MSDFNIFQEERPWGNFRQFTHNTSSTVKIITVKAGEKLSLQSHNKRSEFWRVLKGGGIFEIGDMVYNVKECDEHNVPIGVKHRISAGLFGVVVLEISTGEFDEDDIVHYEDKYGR